MKRMLTILLLTGFAGGAYAGETMEALLRGAGAGALEMAAPLPPPPSPLAASDPFDIRKVFPMPSSETWAGPFTVQFGKSADIETVRRILKEEKLEAVELVSSSGGFYARIEMKEQSGWATMDREFAWTRIMRLTDLTSVSYVLVNKRLMDGSKFKVAALRIPEIKGYVIANDPNPGAPVRDIEWVTLQGGAFLMGTDDASPAFADAKPVRRVALGSFQISRTAVTVEQYAECVIQGKCTAPGIGGYCNWGRTGRRLHPVNCVDWQQAGAYAEFKGARLPTEAEWEYAASGGGRNQQYPWGNEPASCEKAVMQDESGQGCGADGTLPVCSRPAGNTPQGLCDMAGNVAQWVQDKYRDSYSGAPSDGRAVEGEGNLRVARGGSYEEPRVGRLRADARRGAFGGSVDRYESIGFRLAR